MLPVSKDELERTIERLKKANLDVAALEAALKALKDGKNGTDPDPSADVEFTEEGDRVYASTGPLHVEDFKTRRKRQARQGPANQ
jgi:hypothetical protein